MFVGLSFRFLLKAEQTGVFFPFFFSRNTPRVRGSRFPCLARELQALSGGSRLLPRGQSDRFGSCERSGMNDESGGWNGAFWEFQKRKERQRMADLEIIPSLTL